MRPVTYTHSRQGAASYGLTGGRTSDRWKISFPLSHRVRRTVRVDCCCNWIRVLGIWLKDAETVEKHLPVLVSEDASGAAMN